MEGFSFGFLLGDRRREGEREGGGGREREGGKEGGREGRREGGRERGRGTAVTFKISIFGEGINEFYSIFGEGINGFFSTA